MFDVYWTDWAQEGLMKAIYQEEGIPAQKNLFGSIEQRILHRRDGIRQRLDCG